MPIAAKLEIFMHVLFDFFFALILKRNRLLTEIHDANLKVAMHNVVYKECKNPKIGTRPGYFLKNHMLTANFDGLFAINMWH